AWFNPYRAVKSVDDYIVSDFHVSKVHPEWILTFGNYKMLDPGIPEVKEYIVSIVEEVIRNYDVDGIHFDDYFYPYSPKVSNEDSLTFINYGNNFINIDDWRRHNINSMVALVNEKINSFKPHIKFGISPFG
ncbi:MAG TPA: glycoside hydrolase, partial [Ignavibacteriales bacterium]|nr:glycoside hydrolase [Ignavibacteriales bacterium]